MSKSYKIFQGKDGDWYFNILADNGQVMATSEGYTRHRDAVRGVAALRLRLASSSPGPVPENRHPVAQNSHPIHKPEALTFDPGMA